MDLRGEFIRGWDVGRGVDSGRALAAWQSAARIGHMASYGGDIDVTTADPGPWVTRYKYENNNTRGYYRQDTFTRPRNVALLACMKL